MFKIRHWVLLAVMAASHAAVAEDIAKDAIQSPLSVTIHRDDWGTAHIHGKSHEDAFFGMGYVHAQDHFWQLEDTCIRSLGRYAEVMGDSGISSDILNRSFEIVRRSREDFQKLRPEHQTRGIAYTDGINHFLKSHPEVRPRLIEKFEPWHVLAMDRHMILDFIYRRSHVKRPENRGPDAVAHLNWPTDIAVNSWELEGRTSSPMTAELQEAIGSNAWAISGRKTASGAAMLFINPHQPWYGMGQFHEAHVRSEEGLNFCGASFFGNPFPTIGHNEFLGWTYTVNDPDIADAWKVTFDDPNNPLNYRYEEGYRTAVQWTESIIVNSGDAPSKRQVTFRKTHHGPITAREGESTLIAVQVAGLFDLRRADQAWGMVLARNFAEWKAAFSLCAIPMFNVVYADRDGNIFYAYNGAIPIRDPALDWSKPVDGSTSKTEWKGMHRFEELPQVLNPEIGYVQSCNASPFTTTTNREDNPKRELFPRYMVEEGNFDSRRSKMSRLLLDESKGLTFERLQELAYDSTLYWALTEIPKLKEGFERLKTSNPRLAADISPAWTHLLEWDFKSSLESTQTTLCVAWYEELYGFGYPRETLKSEYAEDRITWFTALHLAMKKLKRLYGDWKYPWGQAHRLQRIADQSELHQVGLLFSPAGPSLPIAGTPGPLGIIYTIYSTPEIPFIRPQRYALVGASYMAVAEFTTPIRSCSVMPLGTSGVPDSPHFFDQAPLYASKRFKPVWLTDQDVRTHARSQEQISGPAVKP